MSAKIERVVGLYNWHDAGYCVLEDGKLVEHIEVERYTRVKEDFGDSLKYFTEGYLKKNNLNLDDIDHWVSPCPHTNLAAGNDIVYDTHDHLPADKISFYSHHLCHASHAYFSSDLNDAYILTLDSAGMEDDGRPISSGAYYAQGNSIVKIFDVSNEEVSLGNLWGRFTRFVFKLSSGYPRGHQAGSVMAMAALGDPTKYAQEIFRAATTDFHHVRHMPPGYVRGRYVPPEEDVIHPYLQRWRTLAEESEQEKFNIAAALQAVTEHIIFLIIRDLIKQASDAGHTSKNICLAGGVSLNSVATGKILDRFPQLEQCFIPPVPYDAGLSIGAAQYHWNSVLKRERSTDAVSPYLGEDYTYHDVEEALANSGVSEDLIKTDVDLDACVDLLIEQKIVSIFCGRSESGRRALGNRSILADPRSPDMKDLINQKVKHRQWYRPFAPTILEEYGDEWFDGFFPSPYMSFVFRFREDKHGHVPAVEHFNRTARLQSVSKTQNPYYYALIDNFREKTGVPIILNTSFNDREPICETPQHAIGCFLGTDIDYLYFPEHKILVAKQ
jgi:carbamoyltransferase